MKWYDIVDLEKFVEASRVLIYNNFGLISDESTTIDMMMESLSTEEQKEIEECLPQSEALLIAKDFVQTLRSRKTKKTVYKISEKSYFEYLEMLNSRLVSNMLHSLTNKGILESAYDDKANDFIFWVKDNEEQNDNKKS